MNTEQVELLKRQVEKKIGRTILSSSDCLMLSNDIFLKTDVKISVNTLRRLYSLIKCQFHPSLFTLDLLSRYCNYKSYSDFISPRPYMPNASYTQLEIKLVGLLAELSGKVEPVFDDEQEYQLLLNDIADGLGEWPGLLDYFNSEMQSKDNGHSNLSSRIKVETIHRSRNHVRIYREHSELLLERQ